MNATVLEKRWIITGGACGLASALIYFPLILLDLNDHVAAILGGGWGMLVMVTGIGLYHAMAVHKKTVSAQLAGLFLFIGGLMLHMMIIIQLVLGGYLGRYLGAAEDAGAREIIDWVWRGTAPIHLALDLSWDFFLVASIILLAVNMWRHPAFGRLMGASGVAIAVALGVVNLMAFPFTPEEVGLPYVFGPAAALWFAVACVGALRLARLSQGYLAVQSS
jgi:hypothetical protein